MKKQPKLGIADYLVERRKIKSDFFNQIDIIINWSSISKIIDQHYSKSATSIGRPSYCGLMLFKMNLLQTWYGLSDYEVEDRVNDSISFSRFVGISLEDSVPDHSVLSRFRTELTEKGVYEKLFKTINHQLDKHKILVKTGVLVDASIIDSPLKPKGKTSYQIEEDRSEQERNKLELSKEEETHKLLKVDSPGVDSSGSLD